MTLVGDGTWTDYEVRADVHVDGESFASILGRANARYSTPSGYALRLYQDGRWELCQTADIMDSGKVHLSLGAWHNLRLQFSGPNIAAFVEGKLVTCIIDDTFKQGFAALGCGWTNAEFDNLEVRSIVGPKPVGKKRAPTNVAHGAKATSSSDWSPDYTAGKANDGNTGTRWNSKEGTSAGEWLELDFGKEVQFDRTVITQFEDRITGYKIHYWDGKAWKDAFAGEAMGTSAKTDSFPGVKSNKIRLYIVSTNGGTPSIAEFQVYSPAM